MADKPLVRQISRFVETNGIAGKFTLLAVRYSILVVWLLYMCIFGYIVRPYFLSAYNILNVLRQTSPIAIIGVGMTFVIATRGIDLSVGSTVALTSVLTGLSVQAGLAVPIVVLLSIVLGALVGSLNGYFVSYRRLPPFVVTLATLTLARGLALTVTEGYTVPIYNAGFLTLGRGRVGPVHVPIIIAISIVVIGGILLSSTRFGRHCLAVGGREETARVLGIPIHRIKFLVYVITGVLAGLAGVLITAHIGNGSPRTGEYLELDVITAVVLGGTSLAGGEATMLGTVVGALFVKFLGNGLNLMGVNPFIVRIVTGAVLLAGAWLNAVMSRRATEWIRVSMVRKESE